MTESLRTTTDVKNYRNKLIKEQGSIDPILNEPFKEVVVLDHDHVSQHVRSALNRNTNAFEGLVFNAYRRCLQWLTDKPLPDILRSLATYLEQDYSRHPYHPGWMKRVSTDFNKLNAKGMQVALEKLGMQAGRNAVERKNLFKAALKRQDLGYDDFIKILKEAEKLSK